MKENLHLCSKYFYLPYDLLTNANTKILYLSILKRVFTIYITIIITFI